MSDYLYELYIMMPRHIIAILVSTLSIAAADPIADYVKFVDLNAINSLSRATDPNFRLDRSVIPNDYDITITPFFEPDFNFDGRTIITIEAKEPEVDVVILNTAYTEILEVSLLLKDPPGQNNPNLVITHTIDSDYEKLRIQLSANLSLGVNYILTIDHQGKILGDHLMQGFYRSWFLDEQQEIRWMGTTQFQPGHARNAFPCFDEPFFKARFTISIIRPYHFSPSISNMPIESYENVTIKEEVRLLERFYPTPITSSYLIAFVVSEYEAHDSVAGDKPFAVYGRSNSRPQGQYAQDIGIKLLEAMSNYTSIEYYEMSEHMKMAQVAIPDFSAGAMENWGLLTYREALILNDDLLTSSAYRQRIANIISHEIAHMWFGNLVTCDWWNNLWLNEGFARYYQYFLTHMVDSDFENDIQYVVDQVRTALFADSVASAHALTYDATNSPAEVWDMFSTISYNKGSAIIRMIEYLITTSTFVNGLQIYLRNNANATSLPSDLYYALDEAAQQDASMAPYGNLTVASIMSSWIVKNGYPLIQVNIDHTRGIITVSQQRFWRESVGPATQDLYMVPLTFTTQGVGNWDNTTVDYILTSRQTVLPLNAAQEGWVVFNKKGTGYYRVNYDDESWERIINALNNNITINTIHPLNRALIVDDLFHLTRSGHHSYANLLRYLSFLEHETSYPVWMNALNGFSFLQRRLAHKTELLKELEILMLNSMAKVMDELGFDERSSDSHLNKLLRSQIMNTACNLGHEGCLVYARNAFASFIRPTNVIEIPANLRMWVFCSALRDGSASDYDFLWTRFRSSNVYNEKIEILTILGCTTNENKLREFLSSTFDKDEISRIRSQDVTVALSSAITGNENNTMVVFEWLKNNYHDVMTNYYGLSGVATVISSIAGRIIHEEDITKLEDFISGTTDTELATLANTVKAAAASARANLAWTENHLAGITAALINNSNPLESLAISSMLILSITITLLSQRT